MDDRIATRFSEWCQERGVIQERVVEAMFLFALKTFSSMDVARMLDEAAAWKTTGGASDSEPEEPGEPMAPEELARRAREALGLPKKSSPPQARPKGRRAAGA